jgi:aspartyl-tRNA(Asn)/glutamyl-tRNA(Gln) amidotransferase subunit C
VAVSLDDVRHIAVLARLGLSEERARGLMGELNTILGHMDALSRVDTSSVTGDAEAEPGMPLREDAGPPDALRRGLEETAPSMRAGFFLVPRLATHETAEDA